MITDTKGSIGSVAYNDLKPAANVTLLAGLPNLRHRREIDLSSLQCFYQLAPAVGQVTHIQRCYTHHCAESASRRNGSGEARDEKRLLIAE